MILKPESELSEGRRFVLAWAEDNGTLALVCVPPSLMVGIGYQNREVLGFTVCCLCTAIFHFLLWQVVRRF